MSEITRWLQHEYYRWLKIIFNCRYIILLGDDDRFWKLFLYGNIEFKKYTNIKKIKYTLYSANKRKILRMNMALILIVSQNKWIMSDNREKHAQRASSQNTRRYIVSTTVRYFEVNPVSAQFLFLNLVFSASVVIATNYSWNVHARKQ